MNLIYNKSPNHEEQRFIEDKLFEFNGAQIDGYNYELDLPQFSGHLDKPNAYGQQEVFHFQRKKGKATAGNLKRRLWR